MPLKMPNATYLAFLKRQNFRKFPETYSRLSVNFRNFLKKNNFTGRNVPNNRAFAYIFTLYTRSAMFTNNAVT